MAPSQSTSDGSDLECRVGGVDVGHVGLHLFLLVRLIEAPEAVPLVKEKSVAGRMNEEEL